MYEIMHYQEMYFLSIAIITNIIIIPNRLNICFKVLKDIFVNFTYKKVIKHSKVTMIMCYF